MPLIFLENIGDNPLGKKVFYLKGKQEKNPHLIEIYEEVMKYVTSNKEIFAVEELFLYEHLLFLLNKKNNN